MILIDPDLDPDPTPKSSSANPPAGSASTFSYRNSRLPSTRTLARSLAETQAAVRLRGQVTVLLTTDAALRDLNRRFLGKNKPTDVLSFPATELVQIQEKIAGDIAISVETARRQAIVQSHTLSTELKTLILHGLLHLAGYDHESDSGQMHRRERQLRARLGLPLGLIERTENAPMARALKGHGFSRAEKAQKKSRALAPEGSSSKAGPSIRSLSPALESNPRKTRGARP